ncbi:hypothetical protein LWI29_013660 [Acer saccharum]|uniref:O-fucosyltransferase family protein n=1 Tax=Acer saccharum TaxID=4024 RepID=A0AA39RTZ3_ACESA|nr:hypothetical protein LWI29_013660 [Acer saccharum]
MADKEVTDPLTVSIESITENATVETGLEEDAAATETGSPIHDEMDSFHSQLVEGVSVLEKIIAELKAKRCGCKQLPSPAELRTEGLCPLAPEEADLMLAALGFNRKTRIFVAGAQIYGGVDKIVCSEHLLVALDFIGCTAADAFARQTLGVGCRHWCLVIEYTTEQGRCRPSAKQAETFSHLHEEFHHRVENI